MSSSLEGRTFSLLRSGAGMMRARFEGGSMVIMSGSGGVESLGSGVGCMPFRTGSELRAGVGSVCGGLVNFIGLRPMSDVLGRLVGSVLMTLPLCSVLLGPMNLIMALYSSRVSSTVLLTCLRAECVLDLLKVSLGKSENDLDVKKSFVSARVKWAVSGDFTRCW